MKKPFKRYGAHGRTDRRTDTRTSISRFLKTIEINQNDSIVTNDRTLTKESSDTETNDDDPYQNLQVLKHLQMCCKRLRCVLVLCQKILRDPNLAQCHLARSCKQNSP